MRGFGPCNVEAMPWVLLAVAFVLLWAGSALLIAAWLDRRNRPTLTERLRPFQPTIADDAELWLSRQP
jgi:hypothetical protein